MDARFPLTVRSQVVTGVDGYGNDVYEPQDRTESFYGWAPAGTSEADVRNQQVTHDLDLLVPSSVSLDPDDEVLILGAWFKVEGRLASYDFGPFGFKPGGVAKLRRVTG